MAACRGWPCAASPICTLGEAKTDARDAAIIAEAARTLPHALRALKADSDELTELSVLCGFDDDLTAKIT